MKRSPWTLVACLVLLSTLISACAAPTPQVVEKQVIQTQVVEKIVEKPVVQTQVVEKVVEKVVAPTGTPEPEKVTLTVWDFKSNEPAGAPYYQKADEAFMAAHPNVTIKRVAQPHTEYYQILGTAIAAKTGPDVVMFHPAAYIFDRQAAVMPITEGVADLKDSLAGWEGFTNADGEVLGVPITIQGFAIYFNKDLYTQAGLDPANPPTTWDEMVKACEAIKTKTGKACFTFGDKEGWNADWWLSVMLNGMLTPEEQQKWVAGEMKMTDPKPQKVLELLAEAAKLGWFPEGAASTAMFPDSFEIFERGDAAHVIGLTSDVANWKEFADFLGDKNLGVMKGLITDPTVYAKIEDMPMVNSAGLGNAVMNWTPNKELATEFVKSMASKENLQNYFLYAGAMVPRKDFDTALISSEAGKKIVEWAAGTISPTFHQWMPTAAAQEHERQGQLLLTGAVTPQDAAAAVQKVWDEAAK